MRSSTVLLCAGFVSSFFLGATLPSAEAQPAGPPPAPCAAAEHRQFDFWLGEWEVVVPDKPANRSRITPLYGACGLREEYWAAGGKYEGTSFNIYDAPRQLWHQTWVDNQGALLLLEGGLRGTSMVLEGRAPGPQGGEVTNRITWTPAADGTVRQLWEVTADGGKSWKTAFDGLYQHPAAGAAPPAVRP